MNEHELALWIEEQLFNYQNSIGLMKNITIRKKWEEFLMNPKYGKYFTEHEKRKIPLKQ